MNANTSLAAVTASRDNEQSSSAQASPEPSRPKVSTVRISESDSSSRRESDNGEPEVVAAPPPSEPLVISGLFANQDTTLSSQLEIPGGDSDLELSSAGESVDATGPALSRSGRSSAELEESEIVPGSREAPQSQPAPLSPSHRSVSDDETDDVENDADDDDSDSESALDARDAEDQQATTSLTLNGELTSTAHDTPEPSKDPAIGQEAEQAPQHVGKKQLLPVSLDDDVWRVDGADELLDPAPERTPQKQVYQSGVRPRSLPASKVPATLNGKSNARRTPEMVSKTQPRATRSRRASTLRMVSTCQRLLALHNLGDNGNGLVPQAGGGLLNSRTFLGPVSPDSSRLALHDLSNESSPTRHAQFSGAMRAFGESSPEMNDSERLGYLRKLKGLMVGTSLTPKQAIAILYRYTGDWVIARKLIVSGEESVPGGLVWSVDDDQALQQGMDLDKMEELRVEKGNVEVYRRLQFLNTFHGPKEY
ncbi:hypothetical protein GGI21_003273 [Coemansia aciculifera]|nr:hypothetical protein GGI21_003273 [Coemansia aciculifera]